jgi:hypothetical protein
MTNPQTTSSWHCRLCGTIMPSGVPCACGAKPQTTEPDYKALLLSLLASMTMCDHMGDVCGDVQSVMDKMGVKCDVDLSDSREFRRVLHGLGAKTLYGSEIWDEEDEQDDDE